MRANLKSADTDAKAVIAAFPGLTKQQSVYLHLIFTGWSKDVAAREAGYANAAAAMRSAGVLAAIAAAADRYLLGELVPASLGVLQTLLLSEKTAEGVRANIAFGLLDRAGFTAKRHDKRQDGEQELAGQSPEQLRAAITKLEGELTGRMVDITPNGAPDSEPSDSLAIDFP